MKILRSTATSPFIAAGSFLLYVLIFLLLYPYVGLPVAMLNAIPAITFGLVLGVRGGLFFGLFVFPINYFLFRITNEPLANSLAGNLIGATAMAAVSAGIGWVRDLNVHVHKQAEELQREILRRTRAEEKLTHEALHDPLTELPNRRLFLERIA